MSLSEAMLEVAADIEFDAGHPETLSPALVMSYAKRIRTAVKAAAGQEPAGRDRAAVEQLNKARRIEAAAVARRQAEEAARHDDLRENNAPRMAACVGGNADGLMVNLDPGMPVNARTQIDGTVYRLGTDGKLHAEPKVT